MTLPASAMSVKLFDAFRCHSSFLHWIYAYKRLLALRNRAPHTISRRAHFTRHILAKNRLCPGDVRFGFRSPSSGLEPICTTPTAAYTETRRPISEFFYFGMYALAIKPKYDSILLKSIREIIFLKLLWEDWRLLVYLRSDGTHAGINCFINRIIWSELNVQFAD